jgi:plasmid maintenance system antidote protein VapI
MNPSFWINLQAEFDIRTAERNWSKSITARVRVFQVLRAA